MNEVQQKKEKVNEPLIQNLLSSKTKNPSLINKLETSNSRSGSGSGGGKGKTIKSEETLSEETRLSRHSEEP